MARIAGMGVARTRAVLPAKLKLMLYIEGVVEEDLEWWMEAQESCNVAPIRKKNTRNTDRNGIKFIWVRMNCTEQQQHGPDRHVNKWYVVQNDKSQIIKLPRTPSNHSYSRIIFRSTTRQAHPNTEQQYICSSISQSSERTRLRISKASTISVGTMLQTKHNCLSQISNGMPKPESRLFEQII